MTVTATTEDSALSYTTLFRSCRLMQGTDKPHSMGPFKTGLDWVYRSAYLFRQNPPKWLIHAMLYALLFVMLPSVPVMPMLDRKSTRLNSSHVRISYADSCLKT